MVKQQWKESKVGEKRKGEGQEGEEWRMGRGEGRRENTYEAHSEFFSMVFLQNADITQNFHTKCEFSRVLYFHQGSDGILTILIEDIDIHN